MRPVPKPATTADPGLRLDVDGRAVAPLEVAGGVYRFSVGPGAARVRLVSRSVVPGGDDPDAGDQRRLGVALHRVVLRRPGLELFLPHDDPSFVEGFHPAEAGHRWTDGAAVLPAQWLRAAQDGFVLEIFTGPSALRYLTDE
jgi:hypothetical protein